MTKNKSNNAFTLVEVTLALGIMAFSLVAILGLLPVALHAVNSALNLGVQARILQATQTELLSIPFSTWTSPPTTGHVGLFFFKNGTPYLFFDENGISCEETDAQKRYDIILEISTPTALPGGGELKHMGTVQLTGSNVITHRTYTNQFYLPDNGY